MHKSIYRGKLRITALDAFDTPATESWTRAYRPGLVSIITPTLNAGRFIETAAKSVLGQKYHNIEYIIVDSGSQDDTAAIGASLSGGAQFIVAPELNQAQAINFGFRRAHGEFFGFLNGDDELYPSAIEAAVEALQRNPGAPFAYGDAIHIDVLGKKIAAYPTLPFSASDLSRTCFICQPATLIRSRDFAQARGLDETLETAFDYDLWIRLTREKRPVYVPQLWAASRMHVDNKSLRNREVVYRETLDMLKRHFGYAPFNWIHAYAGYLVDGSDYFFEAPHGSPRRTLMTLGLGLKENKKRWFRFVREFLRETIRLSHAEMRAQNS